MREEPWRRQAHSPWSQELVLWPPGEHLGGRNAIWCRVLSEVRRGFPLQQISFEAVIRGDEGIPCEAVGWQEQERAFSRRRLLIPATCIFLHGLDPISYWTNLGRHDKVGVMGPTRGKGVQMLIFSCLGDLTQLSWKCNGQSTNTDSKSKM